MGRKSLFTSALLITGFMATPSMAADSVMIEKNIAVEANSELHINIPVGELKLESYDGHQVLLQIEVEKGNNWFSSVDLEDAKLSEEQTSEQLKLAVELENTTQEWVVKVPNTVDLDLDIGVGEARLRAINSDVKMDVGVGSADIRLATDNYATISLDAGVGDAKLRDFDNAKTERAVVSAEVDWSGNGEHVLNVDVGVGDVEVSLD